MPWKLVGSLSPKEFQAHLAWAFPDDRSGGTSFQAPQGPNTQFSSVELGRFPSEPLPRTQDLEFRAGCDLRTNTDWRQGPRSPGQAPGPRASARTSAQPPGDTWAGTPGRCCCAPCHRPQWSPGVLQLRLEGGGGGLSSGTMGPLTPTVQEPPSVLQGPRCPSIPKPVTLSKDPTPIY